MSVDEYHRLIDIGFFHPEERLELVEGVLREMSPISPRHRDVVHRLLHLFQALGDRAVVFMQSPVVFDALKTEPEPDLVVVKAPERLYRSRHPSEKDVLCIVEVAQSSLEYDQSKKTSLYAAAGIQEYWIVNLIDDQVEVYRDAQAAARGAAGFRTKQTYQPDDEISPLAFPDLVIDLSQVF